MQAGSEIMPCVVLTVSVLEMSYFFSEAGMRVRVDSDPPIK